MKRREPVCGSWVRGSGKFGVVFDSSGAEECVSAVAVVKEEELLVVS